MSARLVRYALALFATALLMALVATAIAPAGEWPGAVAGAGIAFVVQVALVAGLGALFAGRRLVAAGLAMLGRFAAFAAVALVLILVPEIGVSVAVTLLTLVAVFTAGALLEPVFFRI